ncbi:MAG TPA: hypothetical protein VKT49_10510 [Bryobacteraceae bacterium]|nr:hypothetical protein [Bryobacteraceae bacterium]
MNRKLRAALLPLPAAGVLAAAIWGGLWYRSRGLDTAEDLKRLPITDAVVVSVDFAALRRAGVLNLLESSKVAVEPEYQEFERQIDFNYQRDLDSAVMAVAPTGKFLLVRGRFNWKRLRAYVESQNGHCDGSLCRFEGSTPERRISFFPVRANLMALAVSPDASAALRLSTPNEGALFEVPAAPLWVSVPAPVLQSGENLPAETRSFAQTLARANSVVLAFIPEAKRFAARLEVRCRSNQDAAELAAQLNRLTALLRQTFASENKAPNPADLTGVLAGGSFAEVDRRVTGYWPIERAFLQNLLGG